MHIVTVGSLCNIGGYTYTRCRLHEPETFAEIYKDHIPDWGRSCRLGEGQSEDHTQGSLQKPGQGPLRPHRGLSGCARCKNKFIPLKNLSKNGTILSVCFNQVWFFFLKFIYIYKRQYTVCLPKKCFDFKLVTTDFTNLRLLTQRCTNSCA